MATGFDSFNRSDLGAFIQSLLGVRGGVDLRTVFVDSDLSVDAFLAPNGGHLFDAVLFGVNENVQQYKHPTTTIPSPSPSTLSRDVGGLLESQFDLEESATPAVTEATTYMNSAKAAYTYTANSFTGDVDFSPDNTRLGENYMRAPLDSTDDPLYMVADVTWIPSAARNTGVPACTLMTCTGGWLPSDPPSDVVWRNTTGTSLSLHYVVWKRASVGAAWTQAFAPGLSPGTNMKISQKESRIYLRKTTTTIEYWPIETDYNAASVSTITSVGTVFIGDYQVWDKWLLIRTNDVGGYKLHLYFEGSFVETLGAPFDRTDWTNAHLMFGWLAVTTSTGVQFWSLDGTGTVTYVDTLAGSFTRVRPCGDSHAIADGTTLLTYGGGSWSNGGELGHAVEIDDDGYSWFGVSEGYTWFSKDGGSPTFVACQAY